MRGGTYTHFSAAGAKTIAGANGGATLGVVNVNKGVASAVLTIYDGTSTSGTVVAVIDASATGSYLYGARCNNGIHAVLATADADVTITNY